MELREALMQISEIRQRMAGAQVFRGYRSATTALSGTVALLAAAAQARWLPNPGDAVGAYLLLWLAAAFLSMLIIGIEMALRYRRSSSEVHRQVTLAAVEQFLPTLICGALLTFVLWTYAPPALWMLPGLWGILFGLGLFASRQLLPRGVALAAGYYLLAGLLSLALAQGASAFCPWSMGFTFGGGQLLTAGILYWTLERSDG